VLIDYYLYRESIEASFYFTGIPFEDVFVGGLEGMDGALISSIGCFENKVWLSAAASSTHIVER
jgi:hypothetical protein